MLSVKTLALVMLMGAAPSALQAAPADVAAAVKAAGRPAEAVKLDEGRKPAEVLKFLGLERGDRALDMFTASGYYAEIMAHAVGPRGSVLAWNPANFANAERRKAWDVIRGRVPNAAFVATPANALALPANSFDFAMIHLDYHDVYWEDAKLNYPRVDPPSFVKILFDAMKPGGIVGIVDHVAPPGGDTRDVVKRLHRIDPAVIRADFEQAGFVLDGQSDLLRNRSDDYSKGVFDPAVRGKTDRIVYRFKKPAV